MRRRTGFVLVGVGVFLAVLGVLSGTYAYGKVAVAPLNQKTVSYSESPSATIFDVGSQKEITTPLLSTRRVVGDVAAGKAATKKLGRPMVVWETLVYTDKPDATIDADHPPRSGSHDRVAFDARTGKAVDCCGQYTSSNADLADGNEDRDTSTPIDGLYFKFPFHAAKHSYPFWDGSLRKAVSIQYKDTEKIKGLTVYRYQQVIPPTTTSQINAPASVFGIKKSGDVTLDQVYGNTRTLWIEPETGVIIKGQEKQHVVAKYQGNEVATLTDATIGYNDKTVTANVDKYGSLATQLKIVRFWLPVVGTALGVVLLLVGAGLVLTSRTRHRAQHARTHAVTSPA